MKLRVRLAVLFYEVVILLFVCFLSLFVAHIIPRDLTQEILDIIYYEPKMRLLFGLIALLLLIKTHLMAKTIYGVHQKERNIAFDNPEGRVSVSLAAMEDLIRRVVLQAAEVKEVRTSILAGKKGLNVQARLVLSGDVNIPEVSSRVQKTIQRKIQDMIGLEESILVEVDVTKIIPQVSIKKKEEKPISPSQSGPFEGYRA
ncbi:MAG: alkaline shock response membrane anchor protein AmaP [Candidatus Omnitrophota bacterium]